MYTNFRIQNFRGFKDFELKDIKRVNLIAGKNNVGKTALLEAIAIYSGSYEPDLLLRINLQEMRNANFPRSPRSDIGLPSWKILFNDFDIQKPIRLFGELSVQQKQLPLFDETSTLEISLASIDDYFREYPFLGQPRPDNVDTQSWDILEFTSNHPPYYIVQNNGLIQTNGFTRNRISVSFLLSREKVELEQHAKLFTNIQKERKQSIVLEALTIIEPRIKSLEILYDGFPPMIYADIGLEQPIPILTMGDGIERVLSLVLTMSAAQNGILLIDEIENGLHYSIQKDVWKAIDEASKAFNVQIFATTHSREMVMAAHEAFKDAETYDFKYYRLDRDRETHDIEAVAYSERIMEAAEEMDAEVRG
jgi:predicted ATPase